MVQKYVIPDRLLVKRFERDFSINEEDYKNLKRIVIVNGLLPSEFIQKYKNRYKSFGKIQFKEAVAHSDGELVLSSHAGQSRINHFRTLIGRYSNIVGYSPEVEVNNGDVQPIADSWVEDVKKNLGEIPRGIIIGSAMGISAFLGDINLRRVTREQRGLEQFIEEAIKCYTSSEYLKDYLKTRDPRTKKVIGDNLREDKFFVRDCKLMWGLMCFGPQITKGFANEYFPDEYMDYTSQEINGKRFLNIHYPYGDQIRFIAKALQKKGYVEEVYYIGSCGLLGEEGKINDLVVPNRVDHHGRSISFSNSLSPSGLFDGPKAHFGLPVEVFYGSSEIVDSPYEETVEQLEGFREQGQICVDTELFHIADSFKDCRKKGVVYYVSDKPLENQILGQIPESYIGWRVGIRTLLDNI